MEDIEQLENANNYLVPTGRNCIPAISLLYLVLESYINTSLKLTCTELGIDFDKFKTKSVTDRLNYLLEHLKVDSLIFKKAGVYSRISEFTQFRNEIFHDRNVGKELKFKNTLFSAVPF